jgi:polysaccharide export outer membrane protein
MHMTPPLTPAKAGQLAILAAAHAFFTHVRKGLRIRALHALLWPCLLVGGWPGVAAGQGVELKTGRVLAPASPAAAEAAPTAQPSLAQLAAGDLVQISVYQNPDLAFEGRLDERGEIRFPLLGSVRLQGDSPPAAELRLARLLRDGGFVRQPQVSLRWLQAKALQVSVLGLVGRPGRYPVEPGGTRVSELLAQAGGALPDGADVLSLSGMRAGQAVRLDFNLMACLRSAGPSVACGGSSDEPRAEPGDTLFVDRAPVFYVLGEVQRPGVFRLAPGMTVLQALAQAGGLTPRGTERGLRLHRIAPQAGPQTLEASLQERVQRNDVIQVREALF